VPRGGGPRGDEPILYMEDPTPSYEIQMLRVDLARADRMIADARDELYRRETRALRLAQALVSGNARVRKQARRTLRDLEKRS
jgi:hypothetical protein